MFSIEKKPFGEYTKVILSNSATGESIAVIPQFGANIIEMKLLCKEKLYSILDGCATPEELRELQHFKNIKLTPFPNRIKDGLYKFNGNCYQLPLNFPEEHHAIHGFVFDKKFDLIDKKIQNDRVTIILQYLYNKTVPGYPFPFRMELQYALIQNEGFQCTTTIKNLGSEKMPVGDGWHPYFKLLYKVNDMSIKIPATNILEVDDLMIPTGRKILYKDQGKFRKIGNSDYDTGFEVVQSGEIATTELYDPHTDCTIRLWQETGYRKYNFLQVYIPPSRQSVAIEPMTCATDAYNNQQGLIILEPEESFQAACGINLLQG